MPNYANLSVDLETCPVLISEQRANHWPLEGRKLCARDPFLSWVYLVRGVERVHRPGRFNDPWHPYSSRLVQANSVLLYKSSLFKKLSSFCVLTLTPKKPIGLYQQAYTVHLGAEISKHNTQNPQLGDFWATFSTSSTWGSNKWRSIQCEPKW